MTHLQEDTVPAELSALVLGAASAVPAGDYELDRVVRRRRAHRRRTAAATSVLGVAVLAAAVTVPLAIRDAPATDQFGDRPAPAQRLYFYAASTNTQYRADLYMVPVIPGPAGKDLRLRVPMGLAELDAAGGPVTRIVREPMVAVQNAIGLPDGGLVYLAWHGDNAHRDQQVLTVAGPDGKTRVSRQIPPADQLVGATGEAAYLLRRDQLVRHELASGAERPAPAAARVRDLIARGWTLDEVVSDRVLLRREGEDGARAVVVDPSGAERQVAAPVCAAPPPGPEASVPSLRLAPDGRHVACSLRVPATDKPATSRVTVTDVATGERVLQRDFVADFGMGWRESIAWTDGRTFRFVHLRIPPGATGTHDLGDMLAVETITL